MGARRHPRYDHAMRAQLAVCCLSLVALGACSGALEGPPVEFVYRDSLLGIGKIVRITNTSEATLVALDFRFENPNGDVKNHTVPSLGAGETLELGWKKLDGFQIEVGAKVSVRAKGYGLPTLAELVATAPGEE
jgi:hypothetical protein